MGRYTLRLLLVILLQFMVIEAFAAGKNEKGPLNNKDAWGSPIDMEDCIIERDACDKMHRVLLKSGKISETENSKRSHECFEKYGKCHNDRLLGASKGVPEDTKKSEPKSTPNPNSGMRQNKDGVWSN